MGLDEPPHRSSHTRDIGQVGRCRLDAPDGLAGQRYHTGIDILGRNGIDRCLKLVHADADHGGAPCIADDVRSRRAGNQPVGRLTHHSDACIEKAHTHCDVGDRHIECRKSCLICGAANEHDPPR